MGSMDLWRPTSWNTHRERIYTGAFQCGFVDAEPDLMTVSSVSPIRAMGLVYTYIRETFTTTDVLALMRLLSCVCPNMNSQSAPLDETLPAARNRASVWSFISMYTVMPL
jgi:hypothetical protein